MSQQGIVSFHFLFTKIEPSFVNASFVLTEKQVNQPCWLSTHDGENHQLRSSTWFPIRKLRTCDTQRCEKSTMMCMETSACMCVYIYVCPRLSTYAYKYIYHMYICYIYIYIYTFIVPKSGMYFLYGYLTQIQLGVAKPGPLEPKWLRRTSTQIPNQKKIAHFKLQLLPPFTSGPDFFPRASERRVLPIVGVCISSSHLHIFSSSHLYLIFSSSHLFIFTSAHLHICSSSHLLIFTPSHLHIFTSAHLHICSSSHLLIFTSAHLHIFLSSHLLTFSLTPSFYSRERLSARFFQ